MSMNNAHPRFQPPMIPHPTGGYTEVRRRGGLVEYLLNGEPHRLDGPAWVADNGAKRWYVNGKLHRTDGPAIDTPENSWFYIGGVEVPLLPTTALSA